MEVLQGQEESINQISSHVITSAITEAETQADPETSEL